MQYGLSIKWHNSFNIQNVVASVFFARPKNPYVKKSRLFLSDYTRIKGVFFVMFYDWKGGIGI